MRLGLVATLATLGMLAAAAAAAPAGDLMPTLPGYGPTPTPQYSGYLQISNAKKLHYWFIAAEQDANTAPLVLWLNGGPGCSSYDGALYENGPVRFAASSDGTPTQGALVDNPARWNTIANMLYLEMPVGVGFSPAVPGLPLNDTQTADDAVAALRVFFTEFPELAGRKFFITGESYAGVYIPTLAAAILEANKDGAAINLVGIEVGNGCTGTEVGACSPEGTRIRAEYLYGLNMVSPTVWANLTDSNCLDPTNAGMPKCKALLAEYANGVGPANIYNVIAPCLEVLSASKLHPALADPHGIFVGTGLLECIDSRQAHKYLNTPSVKAAFHVDPSIEWQICSNIPYTPTAKNLPRDVYPTLIANMHVEIWEGSLDACVPGVLEWVQNMGFPVKSPWTPWLNDKQLAGYTIDYANANGFKYRSFLKAGHPIPEAAGPAAQQAFAEFIGYGSE